MHDSKGLVSRLAGASCCALKLRALDKSVESCTRSVSSRQLSPETLAKCTQRECTAGIRISEILGNLHAFLLISDGTTGFLEKTDRI